MPSAIPSLNVGGVQPPYDPISSAAGSLQAVNPNELTITAGGTLQFVTGPTVPAAIGTNAFIVNANTSAPGIPESESSLANLTNFRGSDGANYAVHFEAFGGIPVFRMSRADGTAASPTPPQSGEDIGIWECQGWVSTGYTGSAGLSVQAIENWTTAAQGSELIFQVVEQGSTTIIFPLVLTGATGQKAVQVIGGLKLDQAGTFVANGTTAVTVAATGVTANSVIIPSVKTAGGTVTYPPHVGTITAGTNFTMIGAALDTSTYNYAIIN